MPYPKLSDEEIVRRGKELYDNHIRAQVETAENIGKLISINVETGEYEIEIEFVIDTGFEGFLTLPPAVIAELELPYIAKIQANLADNSSITTNVYAVTIVWNSVGNGSSPTDWNWVT